MDKNPNNEINEIKIAAGITREGEMERDAKTAKQMLEDYAAWSNKAQAFIKNCGAPPQDPLTFCRNVLIIYATEKLKSPIIQAN